MNCMVSSPAVSKNRTPQRGFTLVELLVVISIIGVLVSLLLPAVQAAREAGRRAQCSNNLRNIALAAIGHESAHQYYPSGGWGSQWAGDPKKGSGSKQPGGFFYGILPYMELAALHDLAPSKSSDFTYNSAARGKMLQTPIPILFCPSRRMSALISGGNTSFVNATLDATLGVCRTDYAANGGSIVTPYGANTRSEAWGVGPATDADAKAGTGFYADIITSFTGLAYQRSQIPNADISDGTSTTYLVGEKLVAKEFYLASSDGDDNAVLTGDDFNLTRYTAAMVASGTKEAGSATKGDVITDPAGPTSNLSDSSVSVTSLCPPAQDSRKNTLIASKDFYMNRYNLSFGSAHSAGYHMAFCDGHVSLLNFTIDAKLHYSLGNRKDGLTVDMTGM